MKSTKYFLLRLLVGVFNFKAHITINLDYNPQLRVFFCQLIF